jgi:hypothetical protein
MIGRTSLLLLMLATVFLGCTSHYVKVSNDTLHLYLRQPQAESVLFASSLDGFSPRPAVQIDNQLWRVSTKADEAFRYFYIVDGRVLTPHCRFKENDDFGQQNCIYVPNL